jgi:2-phospho-L-lactate guanylyltransferase
MTLTILIPAKSFALGKSRLTPALTPRERAALNRDFLRHVLSVATAPVLDAHVQVISGCGQVLAMAAEQGAQAQTEGAEGHNPALAHALARLPADRPVLILSADLPFLRVEDLLALCASARDADIVIATDHVAQGTNALWLARPGIIPMRFGPGSRAAHLAEADSAGLAAQVVLRAGLARDIDLPEDLNFLPLSA